ncbi:MAG: SDR family NAD(P)-dependent oxidoreductase [Bacteroidales bacterium]
MRKVIIIGASSGIGEKLALHYAQCGCMVGIAARREELLIKIAERYPHRIIYQALDVTEVENGCVINGFKKLVERIGGLDLIVYCSGAGEQNTMLDITKELNTVRVNVEGFITITTAALGYFLRRGNVNGEVPQIVAISSIAAIRGLGIASSYSASKRFQVTYMEGLSQLAVKEGTKITFTTILPGFIKTDFIKGKNYPLTMSVDYAIACIVSAIEHRFRYKIIDWKWSIVVFFWKLIPGSLWRRMKL